MEDVKLENGVYQSISHWGLFDATLRNGLVRIQCDYDGMAKGHVFESIDSVLPLLVVEYENRGMLIIMGDHFTGQISDRIWQPEHEGAMPPRDEFTTGMNEFGEPVVINATRH